MTGNQCSTKRIELLPFAVEALGYNQKVYSDIDRLYQSRKYDFYKAAKEHALYAHQIVVEGGLLQEEYCKKALGILLLSTSDKETAAGLYRIIHKGWAYAYRFVKNNAEIDMGRFMKNALKKAGGIDKVTDDWLNTQLFIIYFLSLSTKKPIVENNFKNIFEQILIGRWKHYDDPTRISLKNATPAQLATVRDLKNRIYAGYGRFTDFTGMYGKLPRRAETMALLYDLESLSCESVFNTLKFTERDIEEVLLIYQSQNDTENTQDAADFLCDAMYVRYMIKAYKRVKQRYFENNRETAYIELEGLEKDLSISRFEISRLSGLLSESQGDVKRLERELFRLKTELAEETKNRQELNGLREFIFGMDRRDEYQEIAPYDLAELQSYKALVVGGYEKWQQRMKELLPRFIFIHPDNVSFDPRLLDGVDAIFVYTQYINHSIYERTMGAATGKRVGYLNQPNEARVLQEIARFIKDEFKPA